MATATLRRRLTWRLGEVVGEHAETPSVRRLALAVPDWPGHVPGQHVDVRLTAADGYSAQRSYSIASAPGAGTVDLIVQRVDDGEVSPYLTDVLAVGDRVELRGPIGGHFVWPQQSTGHGSTGQGATGQGSTGQGSTAPEDGPVQLVAAGSGVAPFLAMLDHHGDGDADRRVALLFSVRGPDDVIGRDRLDAAAARGVEVTLAYTRTQPPGWTGIARRVDADVLAATTIAPADEPAVLVCGPTAFVETVADALVGLGHPPERIKTERFGGLDRRR